MLLLWELNWRGDCWALTITFSPFTSTSLFFSTVYTSLLNSTALFPPVQRPLVLLIAKNNPPFFVMMEKRQRSRCVEWARESKRKFCLKIHSAIYNFCTTFILISRSTCHHQFPTLQCTSSGFVAFHLFPTLQICYCGLFS